MALLLSIDTATDYAGVCISKDREILCALESNDQKNHGAFIQPAIKNLYDEFNIDPKQLDAVVVSAGPGSYTGLRVGLSTAKGLCYALQKPLILINTLEIMAYAAVLESGTINESKGNSELLFCPMIDARRMEVFTALFDNELNYIQQPTAMILTEIAEGFFPPGKAIRFSGNGSKKMENIHSSVKKSFSNVYHSVQNLAILGGKAFDKQLFADLAYSEPFYVKEFFTHQSAAKN